MDLAGPAPGQLDQDVGYEAEPYPIGDVEGQRQRQDGQEGGDRIVEAFPGYETDGRHHQEPDHYQRRGRHRGGEDLLSLLRAGDGYRAAEDRDQGRERQREQEEHPDHHARKARPAAFGDTRPALYVARHRTGAQRPAPGRCQRIDQQDALESRGASVIVEELRFLAHRYDGAHRVEEVRHEQGEDHGYEGDPQHLRYRQHPATDGGGVEAEVHDAARQGHDAEDHTHDTRQQDAQQDAPAHPARHEHEREHEPEERQQNRPLREVAQSHVGVRVGDHDPAVLEPDERDEQPDADRDGELHRHRDGVHDRLAQLGQHEDRNDEALDDDDGHRLLPAQAQAQYQGEGYYGVQAETRGQGHRIVREDAHRYARQRRRHARREEHARNREAGALGAEDRWVDEDDVGHRHEGRQPGDYLRPEVRPTPGELEEVAQISSPLCRNNVCDQYSNTGGGFSRESVRGRGTACSSSRLARPRRRARARLWPSRPGRSGGSTRGCRRSLPPRCSRHVGVRRAPTPPGWCRGR